MKGQFIKDYWKYRKEDKGKLTIKQYAQALRDSKK
jgi:hypothetical protein